MKMRRAFTLMEVNLAMLIMATGVLSVVGLYSMGFRENQQSADDVASAAYAEAVISPIVRYLSDTNMTWSTFKNLPSKPEAGWGDYLEINGDKLRVRSGSQSRAQGAFNAYAKTSWPTSAKGGLEAAGLVVLHDVNSAIVRIGFRAAGTENMLLAAPLYYTEVRFQGSKVK